MSLDVNHTEFLNDLKGLCEVNFGVEFITALFTFFLYYAFEKQPKEPKETKITISSEWAKEG